MKKDSIVENSPFYEIGAAMLQRLELVKLKPRIIMCTDDVDLQKQYPEAEIIIIDLTTDNNTIKNNSVDLIFANLLLPWCESPKKIFLEWRKLLRPEGLLMFSSLGPDTLCELPHDIRLPNCIDMHELGDMLTQVKFSDPVLDIEYYELVYKNQEKLIQELQLNNMLKPNIKLTLGNIFSITYEVIYGHAWGAPDTVDYMADDEGVVRIPLAHLRRRS